MAIQKGRNWSSGDIVTAANLNSIERGVSAVAEEYTPTTWANGNTVTAAGLNNIEQGIANAGSGGGGDFTTANLTIVNNIVPSSGVDRGLEISGFTIIDENLEALKVIGGFEPCHIFYGSPETFSIPLYKGKTCFLLDAPAASDMPTLTGDIRFDPESGGFIVEGDCTITIS